MQAIEIEIDGQHNEALRFRPLQRSIRGRYDLTRIKEPMAAMQASRWPLPIPSQRLGIDPDGNGYLIEPLHEEEHQAVREKIEKSGVRIEKNCQSFENIHVPSWLYWIKRAVESGLAKIVSGKLPETIEGEPIKDFIRAKREPSQTQKLTEALNRQSDLMEQLLTKLAVK